ncbi:MAG: YhjD/YihY/BrkB family envelope integrity protein [Acidimicrobiales bacterium]|jgi:uncharacterized BrkB/YihY/UPF0761 family membrane protein
MGHPRGLSERTRGAVTGARGWAQAQRENHVLVDLLVDLFKRFKAADGTVLAGYLAYRLFLMLIPLAAIVVAVAGFARAESVDAANHMNLGGAMVDGLSQASADVEKSRLPLLLSGLAGFLVASWGLLGGLQVTGARVWQIPTVRFPSKGRAFVRLCGSLLLFALVFYVSALVRRLGVIAGLAGSMATLASFGVAFFGLSWILPRRCREWYWLLPGTTIGALSGVGLQALATFYLPSKLADSSATYGAFGITLTVLSYLFILGTLFVVATAANAVLFERYRHDPPGLLRRAAELVPRLDLSVGSGYVPEGDAAEVIGRGGPPPR